MRRVASCQLSVVSSQPREDFGRAVNAVLRVSVLVAAVLLSAHGFAQQTEMQPVAIRGGKVLTITHGVINNGVVVIDKGKITAVGPAASTQVPANAKVIDATGMTVYPGFIDAESHLGLQEIGSDQMTSDLAETSDEIMPHMHVYDAFHAETELIPVTRINGVTNAVVAPAESDTLPGQDSFIQLAGHNRDEMILARDIALPVNVSGAQRRTGGGGGGAGGGGPRYPSTRMGVAAQLRQTLLDAQEYMRRSSSPQTGSSDQASEQNSSQRGRSGGAGGANHRDLKMEALLPYLRGERPVILAAHTANEVLTAMSIAREFNLKVVLNHVERAEDVLDVIASYKVPVIVGSIWTLPETGDRYDAEFKLPGELAKRGVKIAFASYTDTHNARNLPYAAGYSVAYGLPYDEALKALTINAAEMFGMADKLGSLDVGKTANVVIANGDPLDVKTDVKHVYIAGQEIPMRSRQTELRDEYMPKSAAATK